jgi:uncharacterized membrane protein YphA (DoxX/SURF4 family)
MSAHDLLWAAATILTILAAMLVASNLSARVMVSGFVIFVLASIAWIIAGWSDGKTSLAFQNLVLLIINLIGVWRWYPRAVADDGDKPSSIGDEVTSDASAKTTQTTVWI